MSTFSRSALLCSFPSRPVWLAGALLVVAGRALAQAPAPPFALSSPAPSPAKTQNLNVLIIALDEPIVAAPAPGTLLDGAPLTPAPPRADVPLTAVPIDPASWDVPVQNGALPTWSALAKKRPEAPDPRFFPVPDAPSNLTPDKVFGPNGANGRAGNGVVANSNIIAPAVPLGTLPLGTLPLGTLPLGTLPFGTPPLRPVAPAGRSLLAAVSLRRALAGIGYANVEVASPDSSVVARAMGDRRLPPGTLPTLRDALRALAAAPNLPDAERAVAMTKATETASNAAAALGQATGYRAVVALYTGPFADGKTQFALVLGDSARESGEPILWSQTATDETGARDTGASTGAALLDKSLRAWPLAPPTSTASLAGAHLARARAAGAAGNIALAQDEVQRVITLDPARSDAYVFLGDLLAPTDLTGATAAYRKATQINQKDGDTFAKIALALVNSPTPDWPRVLEAGRLAIAGGADTVDVRLAMARAQFGRGDLYRRSNQLDRAENAEADAQVHLDRALQLAPNNPEALKLLARALVTSGRTYEAVQTLDRVAPLFPKDIDLQYQYALALLSLGNRREDAFTAFARVLKARGQGVAGMDEASAQLLAQGFDEHVFALGKAARQLTDGVAGGSIGRESAFLQLAKLKADMNDAADAIALLRPSANSTGRTAIARSFAATLMSQSLEQHQTFLDTGQDLYRTRANDLFRQAVAQLNAARGGGR